MVSVATPRAKVVSIAALLANSTAAHTTTLGPVSVSTGAFIPAAMGGLWLVYIEVVFGVPTAAINEDVLLQDISGVTVLNWHMNMGVAPMPPSKIILPLPNQGLVSQNISVGNQQQWSIVTPATVSGPGYSVNLVAYIV